MTSPENQPSVRQPLYALLVEDSHEDAELIAHELRQAGFALTWDRVDTEDAYLAHLEKSPAIVLADYSLPQFSGLRALELLQERGLSIPFIVVSGTIGEEAAASVAKQGAADYVLKSRLNRLGSAVRHALQGERRIAYFSMEIALESAMPTYSGGLGVLAGDTIRSAADLQLPMVASRCCIVRATSTSGSTLPAGRRKSPSSGMWSSFLPRCRREPRSTSRVGSSRCAAGSIRYKGSAAISFRFICWTPISLKIATGTER